MTSHKDVAADLWAARLQGQVLPRKFPGAPASEKAAYEIQRAQIDLADSRQIGWKIGATNAQALRTLGFERPFIGPLFAGFRYDNGATNPLAPAQESGVEAEFCIEMGAELPHQNHSYARATARSAIAAVYPSLELIARRFAGGAAGAGPLIVADGGANAGIVVGAPVAGWVSGEVADVPIKLAINGEDAAQGRAGALLWDHVLDAVTWLATHPSLKGADLRPGDLIMTGTCTGLVPVRPGDEVVASFGDAAEIRARFS